MRWSSDCEILKRVKTPLKTPERFFGLHMVEGAAEYKDVKPPLMIFISENTIKDMNPTFEGRPVVVDHLQDDFKPSDWKEADGIVVKSFFNEPDGKNWAEFMVTTEEGLRAIAQGWKLSNAYFQKSHGPPGEWHGITYHKEVKSGEYEHLAIVRNPRYSESVIYTPQQFKEYNERKREENKKLSNEKEKRDNNKKEIPSMKFNIFKREKIENAQDFANSMVELGTAKKQMSVEEGLTIAEKFLNMNGYANGDHMVKSGDEEMSVNEMAAKYSEMKNAMKEMEDCNNKKKNEDEEDKKKKTSLTKSGKSDCLSRKTDQKPTKREKTISKKKPKTLRQKIQNLMKIIIRSS